MTENSGFSPAFSIITATYNAGPLLSRTAACLAAQAYKNFQWIIVDGNSTDDSVQRIKAAGKLVDRWVSEPDEGIADAWNKGLALARGSHILILNAGDIYDPDFLLIVSQQCDDSRIVCSHARRSYENGQQFGVFLAQPHKLNRAMHLPHNWCAVPAHHYRTLGPYAKLQLAMDFEWFHRYYRKFGVAGFHVINQALGTYYLGGASDVHYRRSFVANERILIENGLHPLAARFYRAAYTMKHALNKRLSGRG